MPLMFLEVDCPNLVEDTKKAYYACVQHMMDVYRDTPNATYKSYHISPLYGEMWPFVMMTLKYPFLGTTMATFEISNEPFERPHIDKRFEGDDYRKFTINIPIENCTTSVVTELYEKSDEHFGVRSDTEHNNYELLEGAPMPKLLSGYALVDKPILLDTSYPHRMVSINNDGVRKTISWSLKEGWTMHLVKDFLESNTFDHNIEYATGMLRV